MSSTVTDALEDMVWQFAYRTTKGRRQYLSTGGLSALEGAFEALGWDDPYHVPSNDRTRCSVKGCAGWSVAGGPWKPDGGPYLWLCSDHYAAAGRREPMPEIRRSVLRSEAKRCKCGILGKHACEQEARRD